jgi:hypothetical protein
VAADPKVVVWSDAGSAAWCTNPQFALSLGPGVDKPVAVHVSLLQVPPDGAAFFRGAVRGAVRGDVKESVRGAVRAAIREAVREAVREP